MEKTCSRCKEAKPRSDFGEHAARPDGKQPWCKSCRSHYHTTTPEIARRLVTDHGYTREEADTLAPRLVDDWEECAICGVLGWLVKLNARKGLRFIGAERQNRHFHPDRLDTSQPHTLPNTRILCPTCNLRRGAARFTDQEVLRWVRSQWERLFSPRWLWWLNTEPGEGGREHRNPGRPS